MSEFHIHIDAFYLSEKFDYYLRSLGFARRDFAKTREFPSQFVPNHHLTSKTWTAREFKSLYSLVLEYVHNHHALEGYIEGEFVALEKCIDSKPFRSSIRPPFRLTTRAQVSFRECEIHVSLDKRGSDPQLLQSLIRMGFHTAYLLRPSGITQIFTAQGTREQIRSVVSKTVEYLEQVGGGSNCSVKEERTAKWWISGPDIPLPPIIDSIVHV